MRRAILALLVLAGAAWGQTPRHEHNVYLNESTSEEQFKVRVSQLDTTEQWFWCWLNATNTMCVTNFSVAYRWGTNQYAADVSAMSTINGVFSNRYSNLVIVRPASNEWQRLADETYAALYFTKGAGKHTVARGTHTVVRSPEKSGSTVPFVATIPVDWSTLGPHGSVTTHFPLLAGSNITFRAVLSGGRYYIDMNVANVVQTTDTVYGKVVTGLVVNASTAVAGGITNRIMYVAIPTNANAAALWAGITAAAKSATNYTDSVAAGKLSLDGSTPMTGALPMGGSAVQDASLVQLRPSASAPVALYSIGVVTNGAGSKTHLTAKLDPADVDYDFNTSNTATRVYAGTTSPWTNASGFLVLKDSNVNVGIGSNALAGATSVRRSQAIGDRAMMNANGVTNSLAMGWRAMEEADGVFYSVALGPYALYGAKNSRNDAALTYGALMQATNTELNVVLGYDSMRRALDSSHNTTLTRQTLRYTQRAEDNVVGGAYAMESTSDVTNNVVLGFSAGWQARWLRDCAALGPWAVSDGERLLRVLALGWASGYLTTNLTDAVLLGYAAGKLARNATNIVAIGNWAGQGASGRNRMYLDTFGTDPGTNASLAAFYLDDGTLYLGRAAKTVTLRGTRATMPGGSYFGAASGVLTNVTLAANAAVTADRLSPTYPSGTMADGSTVTRGLVTSLTGSPVATRVNEMIVANLGQTAGELVWNPGMTNTAAGWTLVSNATFQASGTYSNTVRITAGTIGEIAPTGSLALVAGDVYVAQYSLYVLGSSGVVTTILGGRTNAASYTSSQTATLALPTTTSETLRLRIRAPASYDLYVDNVSVRRSSAGNLWTADKLYSRSVTTRDVTSLSQTNYFGSSANWIACEPAHTQFVFRCGGVIWTNAP